MDVAMWEGFAVAAAVLRKQKGEVVDAAVERIMASSPLEGKAEAAWLEVKEAGNRGVRKVILEGSWETWFQEGDPWKATRRW